MRYVLKQTWSNFLIFYFLCDLEFFTQKQKHKSKIKSKKNAYKKTQDAQMHEDIASNACRVKKLNQEPKE